MPEIRVPPGEGFSLGQSDPRDEQRVPRRKLPTVIQPTDKQWRRFAHVWKAWHTTKPSPKYRGLQLAIEDLSGKPITSILPLGKIRAIFASSFPKRRRFEDADVISFLEDAYVSSALVGVAPIHFWLLEMTGGEAAVIGLDPSGHAGILYMPDGSRHSFGRLNGTS
jgi:hypothetical protein